MEIVETPLVSLTDNVRPGVHIVLNTLQTPTPDLHIEHDQDDGLYSLFRAYLLNTAAIPCLAAKVSSLAKTSQVTGLTCWHHRPPLLYLALILVTVIWGYLITPVTQTWLLFSRRFKFWSITVHGGPPLDGPATLLDPIALSLWSAFPRQQIREDPKTI
jgi:hypothetical protein